MTSKNTTEKHQPNRGPTFYWETDGVISSLIILNFICLELLKIREETSVCCSRRGKRAQNVTAMDLGIARKVLCSHLEMSAESGFRYMFLHLADVKSESEWDLAMMPDCTIFKRYVLV